MTALIQWIRWRWHRLRWHNRDATWHSVRALDRTEEAPNE